MILNSIFKHISMKYLIATFSIALALLIILQSCSPGIESSSQIRVMSYNIKFDDKNDEVNGWDQRKKRVLNLLTFYEPDFVGTQEGLSNQLEYLDAGLESTAWIGVGRTDGNMEGEFSAIFYNTKKFELVADSDSTIWLSETPSTPSKSWDAALPRILTWGKFRSKNDGKEFFVFNTHFDHIGDTARAESAKLIVETINNVAGEEPVILTGDFNAVEKSLPYQNLTASDSGLADAFYITKLPHLGPLFTFEGFEVMGSDQKRRIDYIFVNDNVEVQKHAFLSDFRNGRYPSDHLPVIADITLD